MEGNEKTREQLLGEVAELLKRLAELEDTNDENNRMLEVLKREKQKFQNIVEDLPDLVCRYKTDTTITFINESYARYFGRSVEDLIGTSFLDLIPPGAHEYLKKAIASLSVNSPEITTEHEVLTPDGKTRWQLWRDRAIFDESGNILEVQAVGRDITERKLMENELSRKEEMFSQMAENINEVFWLFDCTEQRVLYASPAYEEIWGRPVKDLYARYEEWGESVHPEDQEFAEKSFLRIMETGGGEDRDYRIVRPDGTVRWISDKGYAIYDKDGKVRRIAGTAEDITERKEMEERLRELSIRDELTGLYNRRGFFTIANQMVKNANRFKRGMLLISVDVDGLKTINDTFGHHEGDLVLVETANLLRETFRESDIIARVGGDEFVVLMTEKPEPTMDVFYQRLRENLDDHNAKRYRNYELSMSVGSAFYEPGSTSSIGELLVQADQSMYESKRRRK